MKKLTYLIIGISILLILFIIIIYSSSTNNNQTGESVASISNRSNQSIITEIPLTDPVNDTYLIYSNLLFKMNLTLYGSVYSYFNNTAPHQYTNLEDYYKMFLQNPNDDSIIQDIVNQALVAANNNSVAAVNILIPFVQNIPYDYNTSNSNSTYRKYPYETLYTDTGVCDEKSVLLDKLLEKLGYGVALFDYPQMNHMTAAIQCPLNESNYGSGYCAIETTSAYPIGEISLFYGNNWNDRVSSQNAIPTVIVISEGKIYPFVTHPF